MGHWDIVVPEGTTNRVTNPSIEIDTTGWTNSGLAVMNQALAQSRWGGFSLLCLANSANDLAYTEPDGFSVAATITVTAWVHVTCGTNEVGLVVNSQPGAALIGTAYHTGGGGWERLTVTGALSAGETMARVKIRDERAAGWTNYYVDGVQAEELDHATTYCDGDQLGCEWNGTAHGSTSTRSALSRAGGRVYDLTDDFSMYVTRHIDSGVAPLTQHLQEYALIPGGEVTGYKVHPRVLTLAGYVRDLDSWSDFHTLMQTLFGQMSPDAVPENQPILLQYTEAAVTKEIGAIYEGGLEGDYDARWCAEQRFAIRFICPDPLLYEVGDYAGHLDTEDTITVRYVTGRLRATGQWDDLGLTNNPTANGIIYALLVASDGMLYVGGNFTGMNNVPGRDYVAYYDPQTDTWNTWGAINDFNGIVYCLVEGPDGIIYAGGAFTDCHADAQADYIAQWNGTIWNNVGDPTAAGVVGTINSVRCMCFDKAGNLYIGGDFTNWTNDGDRDYLVRWTGAAYADVDTPEQGAAAITRVDALASDSQSNVYVGGQYTSFGDVAGADNICYWDGTNYNALDSGLNSNVLAIAIRNDDEIYLGGAFTNAGGDANADYVCYWNGTAYISMGTGTSGIVGDVVIGPTGDVWVSGQFALAGGLSSCYMLARWNGSAWSHPDIDIADLGGAAQVSLTLGRHDPVIVQNYDMFIGPDDTGATDIAGTATITNAGSTEAFPIIYIARSGGNSAKLTNIRNETTGKELLFDYSLLDEEYLIVDLRPTQKSIVSSFFGDRADALLKGSDFGTFALRPGTNQITAFVDVGGAPTITAYVVYRNTYWSIS